MKKSILSILVSIIIFSSPLLVQASLKDAFRGGGVLDTVAGEQGAGYDVSQRTIDPIIANIIYLIISFLGVIFLILMIYGGYIWMTAMGDEKKVQRAKDMITAAIIGLIIISSAYIVTYYVFIKVADTTLNL